MDVGVLVSTVLLYKKLGKAAVLKVIDDTLNDAGSIVFIVSAGSALGLDPILLFLSASEGASICRHVSDSFFWHMPDG
ncbi:hypothetical protein [Clostridium sp. AM58-1XD]|uniref:hypothetical protein n=1 Tax=Clostridium sp. AM58-1XD TaxID=2292307 RepID=UPI0011C1225D|nr:hypothetical protein [Clostridium sp. AM58-1XD]